MENDNSGFLVTGASGMLGRYLTGELEGTGKVMTLQRHDADISCDLATDVPDFSGMEFETVFHLAGTCEEADAIAVNHQGTLNLLRGLENMMNASGAGVPKAFVYISSWEVYSPDSGDEVGENHQLWAATKVGQSKALAEKAVREWCAERGVMLTILRPARMFGKGIKGEMKRMFSDVVGARYIHVRDNDARLSLVCALDVAKAAVRLSSEKFEKVRKSSGEYVYNVTDGVGTKWLELADAMSANCGQMKRQTFLPNKWADLAWKTCRWLPAVKASLDPAVLSRRSKSLTLSDTALREALPDWRPFCAIEVIRRNDKDYPYED